MKILVLNGSPKGERSNTMKLTKAFCEGMGQRAPIELEILPVSKMSISDCLGCFSCWSKTPGKCCIEDDMTEAITKILAADVIIWSFPLYYYSLPSRLKAFMDRLLPMFLPFMSKDAQSGGHPSRYDLTEKQFVVISTCGFYTSAGNYTAVDAQMNKLYSQNGYTALYCGQGELFRVPALKKRTDEYLSYVQEAGKEFASGGISSAIRNKLAEPLFPREVFEEMADADWDLKSAEQNDNQIMEDVSFRFTKQMAALYHPSAWPGHDQIVEFYYTDVDKTYQIHLKKDGKTVLADNFLPYTTRIETPFSVWQRIANDELDGKQAMMKHLYTVKGDFDLMLHWDDYFGYDSPQSNQVASPASKPKTKMTLMLIPWITIFTLLPIDKVLGGVAGILLSVLLPFTFLKWRPTVFEYISIFAVASFSLLAILGCPMTIVIPVSYFGFGFMWSVTIFLNIPLTAYYSMNDYNGEEAWHNPLFIRTNRILTACWGVLYLITPIWTYYLLLSPAGPLIGAINSILPILLGLFTGWFQKWYPKHFAACGIDEIDK